MKKLTSIDEFEQLKSNGKHIFLFSANWCPDCRVIEPILPDIETKYRDFTFVYVDRDDFISICRDLDVFGIPSFVAFDNGQEIGRFVSRERKTQTEIETFIEQL